MTKPPAPPGPPALPGPRSRILTLRLSYDLFDRLASAATADRRSNSSMAALLIEDGLSRQLSTHSTSTAT